MFKSTAAYIMKYNYLKYILATTFALVVSPRKPAAGEACIMYNFL